jgi:putative toxin-antitoxin system antitoxin component (TIGR02293 family)
MLTSPVQSAGDVLGIIVEDTDALIEALREGLPVSTFETLQQRLGWSRAALAEALCLPERTLMRRYRQGHFSLEESQRLLRLARIVARGEELFSRSHRLGEWLREPVRGLGGKRPIDYLDTDIGAEEVEDLIMRLLHGIIT